MPVDAPATAAFRPEGLLMMAGLIVAIGAQNALVLRQGLARAHVGPVVALCTVSDWLLIALGVFGFGAWVARRAAADGAVRATAGRLFLLWCALARAASPCVARRRRLAGRAAGTPAWRDAGRTAAALTWLNPHVYLDTVVLLGGVGAQPRRRCALRLRSPAPARPRRCGSDCSAPAPWPASRWLRHPAARRAIDAGIALVMLWVAAQLLLAPRPELKSMEKLA